MLQYKNSTLRDPLILNIQVYSLVDFLSTLLKHCLFLLLFLLSPLVSSPLLLFSSPLLLVIFRDFKLSFPLLNCGPSPSCSSESLGHAQAAFTLPGTSRLLPGSISAQLPPPLSSPLASFPFPAYPSHVSLSSRPPPALFSPPLPSPVTACVFPSAFFLSALKSLCVLEEAGLAKTCGSPPLRA